MQKLSLANKIIRQIVVFFHSVKIEEILCRTFLAKISWK